MWVESSLTECTVLALPLFSMDLTSHISIRLIKTKHIIQRHLYIFASLQLRHAKEDGRALSEVSNYEEKMEVLWREKDMLNSMTGETEAWFGIHVQALYTG